MFKMDNPIYRKKTITNRRAFAKTLLNLYKLSLFALMLTYNKFIDITSSRELEKKVSSLKIHFHVFSFP